MAVLVDNIQLLLCSIKLEVILTLKVIVSFFSYNTQRRNLEELLQVSRDKVASGFTDEIKGTSCLQNKLLELQVRQTSSFQNILDAIHVEPLPSMHYRCCQGIQSILTSRFIENREKLRV